MQLSEHNRDYPSSKEKRNAEWILFCPTAGIGGTNDDHAATCSGDEQEEAPEKDDEKEKGNPAEGRPAYNPRNKPPKEETGSPGERISGSETPYGEAPPDAEET